MRMLLASLHKPPTSFYLYHRNWLHSTTTYAPVEYTYSVNSTTQEVQLSQIDRAALHVTEYFANSLKVTQGHSK